MHMCESNKPVDLGEKTIRMFPNVLFLWFLRALHSKKVSDSILNIQHVCLNSVHSEKTLLIFFVFSCDNLDLVGS